jgi:hypothetical protein
MAEQWRAGLVNLREIMTNVINLGAVNKDIIRLIDLLIIA